MGHAAGWQSEYGTACQKGLMLCSFAATFRELWEPARARKVTGQRSAYGVLSKMGVVALDVRRLRYQNISLL